MSEPYAEEEFLENIDGTEGPLRKIRRRAVRNALELVQRFGDRCEGRGDTPIERVLFAALKTEVSIGGHEHSEIFCPYPNDCPEPDFRTSTGIVLTVQSQFQLAEWRVDFLVSTPVGKGGRAFLIVECDGHDFHERTKEQAARDRSRDRKFQAEGYTVFRFTGSEIWRDPCGCANQIIDWAVEKACL